MAEGAQHFLDMRPDPLGNLGGGHVADHQHELVTGVTRHTVLAAHGLALAQYGEFGAERGDQVIRGGHHLAHAGDAAALKDRLIQLVPGYRPETTQPHADNAHFAATILR